MANHTRLLLRQAYNDVRSSLLAEYAVSKPAASHLRLGCVPRPFVGTSSLRSSTSTVRTSSTSARLSSRLLPGSSSLFAACTCRTSATYLLKTAGRGFHSTPRRRDILFVSVPAFKAFLLSATRLTLVILPFWWRYVHSLNNTSCSDVVCPDGSCSSGSRRLGGCYGSSLCVRSTLSAAL